jgi:hypothetical protein
MCHGEELISKAVRLRFLFCATYRAARGSDQSHNERSDGLQANRRLPVDFKALIRRLTVGEHARQQ